MTIFEVFDRTDWRELRRQKLELISASEKAETRDLDGLLHWINALQDAAETHGYPVFPALPGDCVMRAMEDEQTPLPDAVAAAWKD